MSYFLIQKTILTTPIITPIQAIGLNAFSISQKADAEKNQTPSNLIKTVGLPIPSSNPLSSGQGAESGTLEKSPGLDFSYLRQPLYPKLARQKGYEGKVKIRAYYNQEGVITKVEIIESSGIKMLDESVKNAISDWKLSMTTEGSFEKTFEFKLNN